MTIAARAALRDTTIAVERGIVAIVFSFDGRHDYRGALPERYRVNVGYAFGYDPSPSGVGKKSDPRYGRFRPAHLARGAQRVATVRMSAQRATEELTCDDGSTALHRSQVE
jgi:hypothetical protein